MTTTRPFVMVVSAMVALMCLVSLSHPSAQQNDPPRRFGIQDTPGRDETASRNHTTTRDVRPFTKPPTIEELERRVNLLADEIERLRSVQAQEVALSDEDLRALGLAPSAAATYRRSQGVSIAGYGEMLYENFASEDERGRPASGGAQLDFLRAIIYAGYRFNDKFLFNSEIEIKHANEISVEFAYVDYLPHFHAF